MYDTDTDTGTGMRAKIEYSCILVVEDPKSLQRRRQQRIDEYWGLGRCNKNNHREIVVTIVFFFFGTSRCLGHKWIWVAKMITGFITAIRSYQLQWALVVLESLATMWWPWKWWFMGGNENFSCDALYFFYFFGWFVGEKWNWWICLREWLSCYVVVVMMAKKNGGGRRKKKTIYLFWKEKK